MPGFRPAPPKTSFPDLEERVLERWRETDVFRRSLANREGAPVWSFYEGPPTANGPPGSHHVLSRVFKDIYPRYRTMTGYRVPRKAGWDCHGLPVELEVEKELGIASKQEIEAFGIAEFNQRCRESVFAYVEDWNRLTERIAFWIDLDEPYRTLDNSYIESVWWSLRRLWDDELLYEGHKVVPYCPRCGTALSSHEVALGYRDVEDPSVYVKLPILAPEPSDEIPESPLEAGDQLLVWTTTPWTLISNAAVAVGPEIEYVRVKVENEIFVLARGRLEAALGEDHEVLAHFPGSALAGTRYEPPFPYISDYGPRGHTVLEADFVTTDEGTGLVHTAIAFGEDDFRLGEQYGITLQNPVRPDGTFDERVTDFAGRNVKEADPDIIESLRERGRLFRAETYLHAYPHCWRCDTPLLYYAKASWYVRTSARRDEMLANNEEIGWHPEHVKHGRFGKWLEGNVDWALSRDRYWGTPLPIWECGGEDCEERFCAGSIADLRERGADVPDDLHRPYIDEVLLPCERCGGEMRRVGSVIDTWYDSGAMPFAQFHYPFEGEELFAERFPADYICEAQDQTRGWFYTLLAESTLLFGTSSYRNCVCLGLILDPDGQKMSKSRGNVVDPWEVIATHGADAFRWYYLTSQQPWAGYRFSVETVGESVRQFMLTLWNTYAFWVLYANAEGLAPADFGGESLVTRHSSSGRGTGGADSLDRWALSRLQGTVEVVRERMEDFDCTAAGRAIAAYVDELSNWYVRLSRRRFWEGDRNAFATLRHCLLETAEMLAPFVPFLADEIHDNLAGGEAGAFGDLPDSVHLRDFPEVDDSLADPELEEAMATVRLTVELSNWYVRLSRRRFWEGDRNAFATLRHCLLETAAMLAPFVPFLADEMHDNLAGGEAGAFGDLPESVHLRDFPEVDDSLADPELEEAMATVRLTVELGRAARAQAKTKVRQPLRRAVIVASEEERQAIESEADLVRSELNVKDLDFVHEEAELVTYRVRPNFRSLGPRFGKLMPQVKAAIEALDAGHVARALESGGGVGINVDGHDHSLSAEDVDLVMEPIEGYQVEAEAGHAVALALELDDELLREGLAREIVHAVQNARKQAGLDITDRIELTLGGDEELLAAAREHEAYVAGEVLATSVAYGDGDGAAATVDGRALQIAVTRA